MECHLLDLNFRDHWDLLQALDRLIHLGLRTKVDNSLLLEVASVLDGRQASENSSDAVENHLLHLPSPQTLKWAARSKRVLTELSKMAEGGQF